MSNAELEYKEINKILGSVFFKIYEEKLMKIIEKYQGIVSREEAVPRIYRGQGALEALRDVYDLPERVKEVMYNKMRSEKSGSGE